MIYTCTCNVSVYIIHLYMYICGGHNAISMLLFGISLNLGTALPKVYILFCIFGVTSEKETLCINGYSLFLRQFQDFFFSHFNLISSSLEQLRERIEEALWSRRQLSDIVLKAYSSFVDNFRLLYCAQRIKVRLCLCVSFFPLYM